MSDKRPIIIIKKKSNHAGHHGGAWKVAYADFVTAMMALFIVLWLTSSGEKVKKSIAGYFNDPTGTSNSVGTDRAGDSDSLPLDKKDISQLKERLQQQIAKQADLKPLKDDIEIRITPEGLRIELMESKDGTFFDTGSAVVNKIGKELLSLLAKELGDVPNRVSIEGHTDAQPYGTPAKYDNWELSTDRANSARRLMQNVGLHPNQLAQVRGFADQSLRVPSNPLDPSNRRISVIVHYIGFSEKSPFAKDGKAPAAPGAPAAKEGAKEGGKATPETKTPEPPNKAGEEKAAPEKGGSEEAKGAAPSGAKAGPESGAKTEGTATTAGGAKPSAIQPSKGPMGWIQNLFKKKPAAAAKSGAPVNVAPEKPAEGTTEAKAKE